jgi:hypothetical protein
MFTVILQIYNKPRPSRAQRRHTTSTAVLTPGQDDYIAALPPVIPIQHASTEPQASGNTDVEQAVTLDVPPMQMTESPAQVQSVDGERSKEEKTIGLFARQIVKIRRRRHHPSTEQAYRKSAWEILKAIIFSSWVNVLLVFVPAV